MERPLKWAFCLWFTNNSHFLSPRVYFTLLSYSSHTDFCSGWLWISSLSRENSGHGVSIHPGWDANTSQSTMNTHTHSLLHYLISILLHKNNHLCSLGTLNQAKVMHAIGSIFFLFSTNAKWVILTHTEHNGETAGAEECATH